MTGQLTRDDLGQLVADLCAMFGTERVAETVLAMNGHRERATVPADELALLPVTVRELAARGVADPLAAGRLRTLVDDVAHAEFVEHVIIANSPNFPGGPRDALIEYLHDSYVHRVVESLYVTGWTVPGNPNTYRVVE